MGYTLTTERNEMDNIELKIDRDFEKLIYPLSDDEIGRLTASLKDEGCREPLIVWNGVIVDGHNRHRICTNHDIPFKVAEKDFEDKEAAIQWMIRNQLGRRNLSPQQRVRLAKRLKVTIQAKAKSNQKAAGGDKKAVQSEMIEAVNTQDEIAKTAGVSTGTVAKHDYVEKHAEPEIVEALDKGVDEDGKKMTVNRAYNETKAKIDPPKPKPEIKCTYMKVDKLGDYELKKIAEYAIELLKSNDAHNVTGVQRHLRLLKEYLVA